MYHKYYQSELPHSNSPEADFGKVGRLSDAVDAAEGDDVRLPGFLGRDDVAEDVDAALRGEERKQRVRQGVLDGSMDALKRKNGKISKMGEQKLTLNGSLGAQKVLVTQGYTA